MRLRKLHRPAGLVWLAEDLSPDQANHAGRLATFIYKKLREALQVLQNIGLPYGGRYLRALRRIWTPNDGQYRFSIPANLQYPDIPTMVAITATGQAAHAKVFQKPGSKRRYATILIDVKDIEVAKNQREIGKAIQELLYHIVHEPIHVHNYPSKPFGPTPSGSESQPLTGVAHLKARQALDKAKAQGANTAKLELDARYKRDSYLIKPWEIEAYGRQFAMFYHRRHPRDRFNIQTLLNDFDDLVKANTGQQTVNAHIGAYFGRFRKLAYQNYTTTVVGRDGRRYQIKPFRTATVYIDKIISKEVDRLLAQT